uniref:Uncharacterized protein n=1 Tax=Arundo donax TaxID=35708 RepID=A0A0A9HX28_ARUDO
MSHTTRNRHGLLFCFFSVFLLNQKDPFLLRLAMETFKLRHKLIYLQPLISGSVCCRLVP